MRKGRGVGAGFFKRGYGAGGLALDVENVPEENRAAPPAITDESPGEAAGGPVTWDDQDGEPAAPTVGGEFPYHEGSAQRRVGEYGGPGPVELPEDHLAGMPVPAGGSSCANCRFLDDRGDGRYHCTSEGFVAWAGTSRIPTDDPSAWCSDWFMAKAEPRTAAPMPKRPRKRKAPSAPGSAPTEPPTPAPGGLVAMHNLSAGNLLHAAEVGGLVAPSIAVTRTDIPFDNFGEISLVAPLSFVDPTREPVFDADIYSPRYPRPRYKTENKKLYKFKNEMEPYAKRTDSYFSDIDYNMARGHEEALNTRTLPALQLQFLEQVKGVKLTEPMRQKRLEREWVQAPTWGQFMQQHGPANSRGYNDEADAPYWEARGQAQRKAIEEYWRDPARGLDPDDQQYMIESAMEGAEGFGRTWQIDQDFGNIGKQEVDARTFQDQLKEAIAPYKAEFDQWARAKLKALEGKPYLTSEGGRNMPYTPENTLKLMTKKVRGGENFNYGLGSTRSLGAHKFRSLEQMESQADRLVSHGEMEQIKEQLNTKYFALLDKLRPYHEGSGAFGFAESLLGSIGESYKRGKSLWAELKRGGFEDVPNHLVGEIAAFAKELIDAPTEYFEAKPQRIVQLQEFVGAAVPSDASAEVLAVLQRHGLEVVTYQKSNEGRGDRSAAIAQLAQLAVGSGRTASKELVVYHGTTREAADRIARSGFDIAQKDQGWYTFAENVEDALLHAPGHSGGQSGELALIEARLPVTTERRKWPGWPWLWKRGPQGWYGLREPIPTKYLTVRSVDQGRTAAPGDAPMPGWLRALDEEWQRGRSQDQARQEIRDLGRLPATRGTPRIVNVNRELDEAEQRELAQGLASPVALPRDPLQQQLIRRRKGDDAKPGFEQDGERGFNLREITDGAPESALTDARSWDQGSDGYGDVNTDEGGGNSLHIGRRVRAAGELLERALDQATGRSGDQALRAQYEAIARKLLADGYDEDEIDAKLLTQIRKRDQFVERVNRLPGAQLVGEVGGYYVLRIDEYQAANALGTKNWCIARDEEMWKSYTQKNGVRFFFYVNADAGLPASYAVAVHPSGLEEVYDRDDNMDPAFGEDLTPVLEQVDDPAVRSKMEQTIALKRQVASASPDVAASAIHAWATQHKEDRASRGVADSLLVAAMKNRAWPVLWDELKLKFTKDPRTIERYLKTLGAVVHQFPAQVAYAYELDPKEAARWAKDGASIETIEQAKHAQVSHAEYKVWQKMEVNELWSIGALKSAGLTPDSYAPWAKLRLPPEDVVGAVESKLTPELAEQWIARGGRLRNARSHDIEEWLAKGPEQIGDWPTVVHRGPAEANAWVALGIRPHNVEEMRRGGRWISPEEFAPYADIVRLTAMSGVLQAAEQGENVSPETLKAYQKAIRIDGLTAYDVQAIRKFEKLGYTPDEIAALRTALPMATIESADFKITTPPDEIKRWTKYVSGDDFVKLQPIPLEQVEDYVNAGYTMKRLYEYAEALRKRQLKNPGAEPYRNYHDWNDNRWREQAPEAFQLLDAAGNDPAAIAQALEDGNADYDAFSLMMNELSRERAPNEMAAIARALYVLDPHGLYQFFRSRLQNMVEKGELDSAFAYAVGMNPPPYRNTPWPEPIRFYQDWQDPATAETFQTPVPNEEAPRAFGELPPAQPWQPGYVAPRNDREGDRAARLVRAAGDFLEQLIERLSGGDPTTRQQLEAAARNLARQGWEFELLTREEIQELEKALVQERDYAKLMRVVEHVPGAQVVGQTNGYLVVHITSHAAAKLLGSRNWCISRAASHWNDYTKKHGFRFYFYLGLQKKYAVAVNKEGFEEVYDEKDHLDPAFNEDITPALEKLSPEARAKLERTLALKRQVSSVPDANLAAGHITNAMRQSEFGGQQLFVAAMKNPRFPAIWQRIRQGEIGLQKYMKVATTVGHKFPDAAALVLELDPNDLKRWLKIGATVQIMQQAEDANITFEQFAPWAAVGVKSVGGVETALATGITPEQYAPWKDTDLQVNSAAHAMQGGLTPETYTAWNALGINKLADMIQATKSGLEPRGVDAWMAAGAREFGDMITFTEAGVTPDQVAPWRQALNSRKHYLFAGKLVLILQKGETLKRYKAWVKAGFEPSAFAEQSPEFVTAWLKAKDFPDAEEWVRNGFAPDVAAQWHAHRMGPTDAYWGTYRENKRTPEALLPWRQIGVPTSDAMDFMEAGLTPEQIAPWLSVLPLTYALNNERIRRAIGQGYTPAELAAYQKALTESGMYTFWQLPKLDMTPEEAGAWYRAVQSYNFSDAPKLKAAGYTPESAGALLAKGVSVKWLLDFARRGVTPEEFLAATRQNPYEYQRLMQEFHARPYVDSAPGIPAEDDQWGSGEMAVVPAGRLLAGMNLREMKVPPRDWPQLRALRTDRDLAELINYLDQRTVMALQDWANRRSQPSQPPTEPVMEGQPNPLEEEVPMHEDEGEPGVEAGLERVAQGGGRQPWLACDLDGCLLEHQPGMSEKGLLGAAKPGAAEAMKELMALGWRVSIYTARLTGYRPEVAKALASQIGEWLTAQDIPFTDVWYGAKPRADYFVDDKAVPFTGSWNQVIQQLVGQGGDDGDRGEDVDPEISTEFEQAGGNGLVDPVDGDPNDFDANDALGTRHDRSFAHPGDRQLEQVVY